MSELNWGLSFISQEIAGRAARNMWVTLPVSKLDKAQQYAAEVRARRPEMQVKRIIEK